MKFDNRLMLSAAALFLASCGNWSSMIGLAAHFEGDELVFSDPEAGWFTTHCVISITVTRSEQTTETSWRQVEQMWVADSMHGECLTDLPFRYGQVFENADPDQTTEAKPLQPGFQYEVFIEQGGGAGQVQGPHGDSAESVHRRAHPAGRRFRHDVYP